MAIKGKDDERSAGRRVRWLHRSRPGALSALSIRGTASAPFASGRRSWQEMSVQALSGEPVPGSARTGRTRGTGHDARDVAARYAVPVPAERRQGTARPGFAIAAGRRACALRGGRPRRSTWHDEDVAGVALYGTLSSTNCISAPSHRKGTFEAAISRLDYLKELGVTALELMPVSQFPGTRNWGYDGVYPYAPQNSYGGPSGLKALVDACHRQGSGGASWMSSTITWGPTGTI